MKIPGHPAKIFVTCLLLAIIGFATPVLFCSAKADWLAHEGYGSLRAGKVPASRNSFSQAAALARNSSLYHYLYGLASLKQAEQANSDEATLRLLLQARTAFNKATVLNPLDGNARQGQGETAWWLSTFDQYKDLDERIEPNMVKGLELEPTKPELLFPVVSYYLSTQQQDKALEYVRRLAATAPSWYRSVRQQPGWSPAVGESFGQGLEQALANSLVSDQALATQALMAADDKDWPEAIKYTEQLIDRAEPEQHAGLYLRIGRYYLADKNLTGAKAAFVKALRVSPKGREMVGDLMWPFRRAKALDVYIDLCQEAARFDSGIRTDLPLLVGKAYYLEKNLELAAHYLKESIEAGETPQARQYLAEIALQHKQWDEAELESQRGTVLEPKNSHLYYLLARSLEAQGKHKSALESLELAIEHSDKPQGYYFNLQGHLLWELNRWDKAIAAWRRASFLDPKNAYYLARIARGYRELKELDTAKRYYLSALTLDPDNKYYRKELISLKKY